MRYLAGLFIFLGFLGLLPVNAMAQDVIALGNGQSATINKHGNCRIATNNGGPTTMIPSRTAAEWNSFINGRPGHISLSGCSVTERDPPTGDYFTQLHHGPAIRWYVSGRDGSYSRAVHWQGFFYGNQCCFATLAAAKAPLERDGWMLHPYSVRVGGEGGDGNGGYSGDDGTNVQYGIYRIRTYIP